MDQAQIDRQLAIVKAMADELPEYLLSDNLYHQMFVPTSAGTVHPMLTPGALLENLATLEAALPAMTADQRSRFAEVQDQLARDLRIYGEQWRARLLRELKTTLDSWSWYLDDAERGGRAIDNYPAEAHLRTRIDLLVRTLAGDPQIQEYQRRLADLDARLRRMLQGSRYVGPQGEEARYPRDQAWWLYGRLAEGAGD